MAFVVEDGTGKTNSNSYVSVAETDAYFEDRGNLNWAGTDSEKESYLIQATDYVDLRFKSKLLGIKETEAQALEFPRDTYPGVIPRDLRRAVFEYALRAKDAALMPDPTSHESGRQLRSFRDKTDVLESEWVFEPGTSVQLIKPYPFADLYMREFIKISGSKVIRN